MTKAYSFQKKINFSKIFPFKCIRKQIWPWSKAGQGQPRIIIWTNLVGPTTQMLHTKSLWFWRRRFLKGFYHIWVWRQSWSCDQDHLKTIWTNFRSHILRSLHMKYEVKWPSSLRGEDVWKCWWTPDAGRTDAEVTGILLAHQWAFGSGKLMMLHNLLSMLQGYTW